jgi:hypothetical protein
VSDRDNDGSIAGWFARFGIGWGEHQARLRPPTRSDRVEAIRTTRALRRFLEILRGMGHSALLDLGPLCGSNVAFFGDQLSCRVVVTDLYAELDRSMREGGLARLPGAIAASIDQPPGSLDGVVCWDVCDYLTHDAARALSAAILRVLKPGGVALTLFSTLSFEAPQFTRFVITDPDHIRYRPFPSSLAQQRVWLSRDTVRLFAPLNADETYLQWHGEREVLLRKSAAR